MSHREALPSITLQEIAAEQMIAEGGPTFEGGSLARQKAVNNYRQGDAEGFLLNNASLWSGSEYTWQAVREAKGILSGVCASGFDVQLNPEGGLLLETVSAQSSRKVRRQSKSEVPQITSLLLENTFRLSSNCLVRAEEVGFFEDPELLAYDTSETAQVLIRLESAIGEEAQNTILRAKEHAKIKTKAPAEMDNAVTEVVHRHVHGLAIQRIAQLRIADFLSDDANVAPFLDQVTNLLELRKQNADELPGFLEILATQIGEAQSQGTHPLQEALNRTAEQRYPRHDFVAAMLNGEDPQGGKLPKEFLGSVSGVKMAASIIARRFGDQGVDLQAITAAIVEDFDKLPPEWEAAYQASLRTKGAQTWQGLCEALKPYERRGRFLSRIKTRTQLILASASHSSKKRHHNTSGAVSDVELAVVPPQEEVRAPQLAVMRRSQGNAREFSLDMVDDIPALLGHAVVGKFLDQNEPGMADLITAMFEDIHKNPYSPINSKIVRSQRFSVVDERVRDHQSFRMRRLRPNSSSVTIGAQGNKVRVFYGIIPSTIGTILGIKSIEKRDQAY